MKCSTAHTCPNGQVINIQKSVGWVLTNSFIAREEHDMVRSPAQPSSQRDEDCQYFRMLSGQLIHEPGRAHALKKVRELAYQELFQRPAVYPPSVRARNMPWYEHAVVPTIAVLLGHAPSITCTANIGGSDDIAQERMVRLDRSKLTIKSPGQPPPLVAE
ncbi:MAG: hypothetical protein CBHOC_4113 [uncultured Caballeronia sp.]|nr:MAG: hypothetical protein CBHOC_4113 [uncultured Caballeronia sp.]